MSKQPERRRVKRLQIESRQDLLVKVREMSVDGCSLETDAPIAANGVHNLSLEVGDGSMLMIRAWVIHTRRERREDGPDVFITGLEFVDHDAVALENLDGLVAAIGGPAAGPPYQVH